ncbi:MAG: DUF642 domain-containing protein [Capsulimonas sp.]|uniref:DUF642 domain-containing protein n=1 Tax=Capsulimonas sp. TaxID=2494211 RepID=UPI003266DFBE
MQKNIILAAFAAAAMLATMGAARAEANLLINGNFEAPTTSELGPNSYVQTDTLNGWTLTYGSKFETMSGVVGQPYEGKQFVELASTTTSGIQQTVDTVAGKTYVLGYAFSARPGTSFQENDLGIFVNNLMVQEKHAVGSSDSNSNWKYFTYAFTATGDKTTIGFGDLNPNSSSSLGTYIDATHLAAVPEPSSVAAFMIGGLALGALALRRRKSVAA